MAVKIFMPGTAEPPVMNEHLVPAALRGTVSACCASMGDCENLINFWGRGRNYMPLKPILLILPFKNKASFIQAKDKPTVVFIACEGVTPASELQDLATTSFGRALKKLKDNDGLLVNSDEMREKFGLVPQSEAGAAMQNAMLDRVKRARQNPVTDSGVRRAHELFVRMRSR